MKSRAARQAAMPFIMLTVLIDMMAIGLIIPVLPALVGAFAGSQADQALWYGAVTFASLPAKTAVRDRLNGESIPGWTLPIVRSY